MNKVVSIAKEMMKRSNAGAAPARLTGSVDELVAALRPEHPLYVIWPEKIQNMATRFMNAFAGETLFAVKTNPHESVIQALYQAGMMNFDAASLEEVRLVRRTAPKARIHFMHTVKSPEAIRTAYADYGVRDFTFDTFEELNKILAQTNNAPDLHLYVRFAMPKNAHAAIDFSSKFGCFPDEAALLLRAARPHVQKLGLCFHVGTQTTDASVYTRALAASAEIIQKSGVEVELLDVGGGFPVRYPDQEVPAFEQCLTTIHTAVKHYGLDKMELLAEPGRVLVADGGALIARVELRKGQMLYLNDGTYGGLFDAGPLLGTQFPVRALRPNGVFEKQMMDYSFAGPTCDSLDMMQGPFVLPADIRTGDWIEIGNLGAYSQSMRTNFNGFGASDTVCLY